MANPKFKIGDKVVIIPSEGHTDKMIALYNKVLTVGRVINNDYFIYEIKGIPGYTVSSELRSATGADLIHEKRHYQVNAKGYTPQSDAKYINNELLDFAQAIFTDNCIYYPREWDKKYFHKIMQKERIEQLIDAGAIIAAEIDRLLLAENNINDKVQQVLDQMNNNLNSEKL